MLPDVKTQSDTDQRLGCRHSRYFGDDDWLGREKINPADVDLAHAADHALWQDAILRAMDYDHIQAYASDGIVGLYGHVSSKTNRLQAERAVRRIAGLQGISNCLVADEQLLSEVATALSPLEHAYGCKFFTGVSHGVVLLNGAVENAATRDLAEQCVASNPKVRGVINSLLVGIGGLALPELPFLQPYIGAEFFFLDGVSGRVRQVIIDPNNRRVVAMTLQGRFAGQWQAPSASRPAERILVVSLSTIRYLTKTSGFLNIRFSESDRYSEFNGADFHAPPADWLPPYPYCPVDVLLSSQRPERTAPLQDPMSSPIAITSVRPATQDELLENDSPGG